MNLIDLVRKEEASAETEKKKTAEGVGSRSDSSWW